MQPVDYIALAIPVFFLLIGIEAGYARWSGGERIGLALAIGWSVLNVGLLFDRRARVVRSELLRLAACVAAAAAWASRALTGGAFGALVVGALVFTALSAGWLLRWRSTLAPSAVAA